MRKPVCVLLQPLAVCIAPEGGRDGGQGRGWWGRGRQTQQSFQDAFGRGDFLGCHACPRSARRALLVCCRTPAARKHSLPECDAQLRDDERARKEQERREYLKLPVWEKKTWSSRAGGTSRDVLRSKEDDALRSADGKKGKFGGLGAAADTAYRQERHREKENMTDFIEKKRQMFLVQMSLDTKRAEIRKLEEQAQQREEALRNSEQMLEADAQRFESFLKKNDQQAVKAIKDAETETKLKQDKVQEIKKLTAQIAAVNSETTKYAESLEECQSYKKFLDDLTPQEWIEEQHELHRKENEQKRQARKDERRQAREMQDRQAEDEMNAEIEAIKGKGRITESMKKMIQQREAEFEASKEARAAERVREDAADDAWDPDEGVEWEPPMYFTRPQQLLDIFAALEERNLFLIQNSQETEEQLEELKQKLEHTKDKMNEETEQLNAQINSLKAAIAAEEAKAATLGERGNPHRGPAAGEQDTEALLAALHKRVAEVYERCGIGDDSTSGTLMMLANIEHKLEENLAAIERMPPEEVPSSCRVSVCMHVLQLRRSPHARNTHTNTNTNTHIHARTHAHTHTHIHTRIPGRTHTHTHTHTHMLFSGGEG